MKPGAARAAEMARKIPQQERSRSLVEGMLAAAGQLLTRRSLSEVTTNHIAQFAGVSVGSLYQYFGDKYAIAQALLERHQQESIRLADDVFAAAEGERFAARCRTVTREIFAHHQRARTLHLNFLTLEQPAAHRLPAMLDHLHTLAGALQSDYPGLGAASSRAHAEVIAATGHTLIHSMIDRGERDTDLVEHYDAFIDAYLQPLRQRPGSAS